MPSMCGSPGTLRSCVKSEEAPTLPSLEECNHPRDPAQGHIVSMGLPGIPTHVTAVRSELSLAFYQLRLKSLIVHRWGSGCYGGADKLGECTVYTFHYKTGHSKCQERSRDLRDTWGELTNALRHLVYLSEATLKVLSHPDRYIPLSFWCTSHCQYYK